MRTTKIRTPGRAATAPLAALLGAALLAGACAAPLERRAEPVAMDEYGQPLEGAGGTWALVMPTPGVAQMASGADLTSLPEYARNDAALGNRPRGPLLATTQWPEPARASLAYPRRVFLDPRPDTITFFEPGPTGYGGYGHFRSYPQPYYSYPQPYYVVPGGGNGGWGFWR